MVLGIIPNTKFVYSLAFPRILGNVFAFFAHRVLNKINKTDDLIAQ